MKRAEEEKEGARQEKKKKGVVNYINPKNNKELYNLCIYISMHITIYPPTPPHPQFPSSTNTLRLT